ncbi:competence type IV pilus assembly protein ComGB [Paraliobacillus quinghaiensis]|nr:competence type IV pilus assembly protein ComGB [Paraliobacillus quinghaiensis]
MVTPIKRKQHVLNKAKALSLQEQNYFLIRLSRLLDQHYTLLDALTVLQWNTKWEKHAELIESTLKEGNSLDIALNKANFDSRIISFLYFAMKHGNIKKALLQSIQLVDQQLSLWKKFKQVTQYPIVLFFLFILLLYFIKTSVFPSFIQLFSTTTHTSDMTSFALNLINILFQTFLYGGIFIICCGIYWLVIQRKLSIYKKVKIYQRIPLLKKIISPNATLLFSLHLSSLLQAGLSLKDCFDILTKQSQNPLLAYHSEIIMDGLKQGQLISQILPGCALLEQDLHAIFQKNTTSEMLAKDLQTYADFLLEHLQLKIKKFLTLIQPTFFIIIATCIIFIYLSLLLPMFQLINTI